MAVFNCLLPRENVQQDDEDSDGSFFVNEGGRPRKSRIKSGKVTNEQMEMYDAVFGRGSTMFKPLDESSDSDAAASDVEEPTARRKQRCVATLSWRCYRGDAVVATLS